MYIFQNLPNKNLPTNWSFSFIFICLYMLQISSYTRKVYNRMKVKKEERQDEDTEENKEEKQREKYLPSSDPFKKLIVRLLLVSLLRGAFKF